MSENPKVPSLPDINERPKSARSQASALSGRAHPQLDLEPAMEQALRECFKVFDVSNDGNISASEF